MNKKTSLYGLILTLCFGVLILSVNRLPMLAQSENDYLYLPLILNQSGSPEPSSDWHQHAADAQRTSYISQAIPTPWRWKWAWKGPNASGGISNGKFRLPRNSQPVVGGGRVYIAAGTRGVYALNNVNGAVIWNRAIIGAINSTPAYDPDTQALFVLNANGTLYKLNSQDGSTLSSFSTGAGGNLFTFAEIEPGLKIGDLAQITRRIHRALEIYRLFQKA